jgi:O-acetyl-ADP-ribose deacetylase (regulator of RNase III)
MIERFIIASPSLEGSSELRWATRSCNRIEIFPGRFEDLAQFDCVATAGNSFGLMDAGFDLAVHKFFGPGVQERIQQRILSDFLGEQPVGTSILVPTGHDRCRWVAHSPTMRIPMNIEGTDHVYLAAWATILEVARMNASGHARIATLVLPAFGTGTGGMSFLEAGTQIRIAVEHYLRPPEHINPSLAQIRHERIHYGGRWGFQHPRPIA